MVTARNRLGLAAAVVVCALGSAGLATHSYGSVSRELATARPLSDTAYVGSAACKRCHPDHSESFARTFHRTMTQEAHDGSVLGAFDAGASLDYFGVRARMTRGSAGEFLMTFSADGGAHTWRARVERTVGSRRYQQYLARDRDVYFRLPVAWDIAEQRFIHMNGAFLTPDPEAPAAGGSIEREDYDRHVTRWNDNCVFCHNVHPNPGLDAQTGTFETRVAELGIACEACHGPGADHVARNENPLRRYALQVSDRADPSIRNPARMIGARSAEVCGRCHGQRLTGDIGRFMREGDPFVPGDPLSALSKPLWRDTTQNGEHGLFAARFWNDGTARLTAYEFQGYLQSPCRADAAFSCESCHAMHRGDPRGQIHPERTGDSACTQCHTQLAAASSIVAHTRHDPAGPGARCTSCHMPKVVYGLVTVHLSHRIEVPDPARQASDGRPDACTSCHVDRSRSWAIAEHARLFGGGEGASRGAAWADPGTSASTSISTRTRTNTSLGEDELAQNTRQLFGGDPIERAVAARAIGEHAGATSATQAERATSHMRALRLLTDVMVEDAYPAVRSIAARSAREILARSRPELASWLAEYVPTWEPERRRAALTGLRAAIGPPDADDPNPASLAALRGDPGRPAIFIGE